MATCTVLYNESKEGWDNRSAMPVDQVRVTLRKWDNRSDCDVVLQTFIKVDGNEPIHTRAVYNGYGHTDAEFQRKAIAQFDRLLAAHPTLGGSDD